MMKFFASAATVALVAGAANAQINTNVNPSIDYALEAEVGQYCGIYTDPGFVLTDVDFGDLADTAAGTELTVDPQGSLQLICNDPAGLTRTVSSANNGVLVRTGSSGGSGNEIAYSVSSSGGYGFAKKQLSAPDSKSFGGSGALRNGQQTNPQFYVNGVQIPSPSGSGATSTSVFAGDYTDTLTFQVTAN